MPRRKPASSKQRKAELQLKRAIKRGDIPAPPPRPKPPRRQRARASVVAPKSSEPSSKRLQSAFLKVEGEYLEHSRHIAAAEPLRRPLSAQAAVLNKQEVGLHEDSKSLTCPKRPKWRFDMAKKEVEKNEEAMFKKWTDEVDGRIDSWRGDNHENSEAEQNSPHIPRREKGAVSNAPHSPTFYERNLEVWRQFWRVSEISQILLLLLDSRCPALHFPPSLQSYLASLRPARPIILVLTKSDLVPAPYTASWSAWLQDRHPYVRVVKVESYRQLDESLEHKGQGQRKRFEPEIKQEDLNDLVHVLKSTHQELLTPHDKVCNDAEKMDKWKPTVRQCIDWEAAQKGGRAQIDQPTDDTGEEYITIGLIGQPNVGKSSLLNALFGSHKVKASRTPGKTKHFQTLFWTPEIRLVDCPGLVMPNYVHMELQVLSGILPISQIPSIPACTHYALRLLPLENILRLTHPSETSELVEDKRTWRDERSSLRRTEVDPLAWTAMDVLTAYATKRGWVTAKAGRPDANRAGNALLRTLAEGKIRWAFWPPDMPLPDDIVARCEGNGIWLGDTPKDDTDEEGDGSDNDSIGPESTEGISSDREGSMSEDDEYEGDLTEDIDVVGAGRFDALNLEQEAEGSGASDS